MDDELLNFLEVFSLALAAQLGPKICPTSFYLKFKYFDNDET